MCSWVVSDFLVIWVVPVLGQRLSSSDDVLFAGALTWGAVGRKCREKSILLTFVYLVCWGTEVVTAIYCLRNLITQEISPRLRSAVFKPLYATRATEKALGHQRKFDPPCSGGLLYSILVAVVKTSPKPTDALVSMTLLRAHLSIAPICFSLSSNNAKSVEKMLTLAVA